jgi:hypothetical protein
MTKTVGTGEKPEKVDCGAVGLIDEEELDTPALLLLIVDVVKGSWVAVVYGGGGVRVVESSVTVKTLVSVSHHGLVVMD